MVFQVSNYSCSSHTWASVRSYSSDYSLEKPVWLNTNDGNVKLRVGANGDKVEYINTSSSTVTMNLSFSFIY